MRATLDACRFVWNKGLEWCLSARALGSYRPSRMLMHRQLPAMKRAFPWLRDADSSALQDSLSRLDVAWSNHARDAGRWDEPTWRARKGHDVSSYATANPSRRSVALSDDGRRLRLPKLGEVRVRGARSTRGAEILSAVVRLRPDGRWECVLRMRDVPVRRAARLPRPLDAEESVVCTPEGVVTTCHGTFEPPASLVRAERRAKRCRRRMMRRRQGSARFERARRERARAEARLADARHDWAHKVTSGVCGDSQVTFLAPPPDDGNRSHGVASPVAREVARQISYKCLWRGVVVEPLGAGDDVGG